MENSEARFRCQPYRPVRSKFSPLKVSRKREFLRFRLETFGRFSLELSYFGAWRLVGNARKLRKMQDFRAKIDYNLRSSEWLAGDAVLIAPVSGLIPCFYRENCIFRRTETNS